MKLYAAPLQGFTESAWRHIHHKVFGGIDAYYTPFVRIEKGTFRHKDVRDIGEDSAAEVPTIPQLIAATPAELEQLAGLFAEHGYKEADINMGCPFPLIIGKQKGSGILPYPEKVKALLDELKHHPSIRFSVKMRLGLSEADEWKALLPMLNEAELTRIVLHPRIGKQQYKGEVCLDQFSDFYQACKHPLVYNGDLMTVEEMHQMVERFPNLEGLMLGRGLLANPLLAAAYQSDRDFDSKEIATRLGEWHDALYRYYADCLQGETQLLAKMKPYWEYLYPEADRKLRKAIHKANTLSKYQTATRLFIESLAAK